MKKFKQLTNQDWQDAARWGGNDAQENSWIFRANNSQLEPKQLIGIYVLAISFNKKNTVSFYAQYSVIESGSSYPIGLPCNATPTTRLIAGIDVLMSPPIWKKLVSTIPTPHFDEMKPFLKFAYNCCFEHNQLQNETV